MVRLHLLVAMLLLSGLVTAAPPSQQPVLQWQLNKQSLQLGHHLRAELFGIGLRGKLSDIDLQPLNEHFGFTLEETVAGMEDPRWPQQTVQRLLLKLYPRHTGTLTLPSLAVGGARSQPLNIIVTPGINKSRTGDSPIEQRISISATQPWQRQQVRIEMELVTSDRFASLQTTKPEIAGFEVFALPSASKQFQRDGREFTRLQIGWALFPLFSGQHTVELPPIEYRKSGRSSRIYYLPRQRVEVKPLPPYIPPTMPVGRVDITSTLEAGPWLEPQTLSFWHVTLTGDGVSPSWMPPLLHELRSNKEIRFLPAKSELTPKTTPSGLQSQVTHHVPFKPGDNGRVELPSLRIQYFDPHSGKILATTHQPPFAFSLSKTWRTILLGLLGLLSLLLGRRLYGLLTRIIRRRRLYRGALQQIENADSAQDIREVLTLFSAAEGWPTNLTLRDWAQRWIASHRHCQRENFEEVLRQLARACYARTPTVELSELRRALLEQLHMC